MDRHVALFIKRVQRHREYLQWRSERKEELEIEFALQLAETDEAGRRRVTAKLLQMLRKEGNAQFSIRVRTAPKLQIAGAAGIGKTRKFIEIYRSTPELWSWPIEYYTPTTELGKAVVTDINESAPAGMPPAQLMTGRTYTDGSSPAPCKRADIVSLAQNRVSSVYKSFCDNGDSQCGFFNSCEYIRRRQNLSPCIRVFPHASLATPQVEPLTPPKPYLVVIDEAFRGALVKHTKAWPDAFGSVATYVGEKPTSEEEGQAVEHAKLGKQVAELIQSEPNWAEQLMREEGQKVSELARNGGDTDGYREEGELSLVSRLRAAAKAAEKACQRPDIVPSDSDQHVKQKLEKQDHGGGHGVAVVLRQVVRDLPFGSSIAIEYVSASDAPTDKSKFHPFLFCHGVKGTNFGSKTPLLLLDADAMLEVNVRLIGCSLSELKEVRIPARRQAHFVQCFDQSFSTTALSEIASGSERADSTCRAMRAEKRRNEVMAFARRHAADGKKVFVAMPKSVRKAITGEADAHMDLLHDYAEGVRIGHYGNLTGQNHMRCDHVAIIIGRNQPRPIDIEREARAIYGNDRSVKLSLPGEWTKAVRPYGPDQGYSQEFQTHEDPRVRALLEATREREVCQAIDRLRLLDQDGRNPVVIILGNLPLPGIVPDELWRTDRIMKGGTRLERAASRGLYTTNAQVMAGAHPDLWATKSAAAHSLEREETPTLLKENYSYAKWGFLLCAKYRVSGAKKPSLLWYDPIRYPTPGTTIANAYDVPAIGIRLESVTAPMPATSVGRALAAANCNRRQDREDSQSDSQWTIQEAA